MRYLPFIVLGKVGFAIGHRG